MNQRFLARPLIPHGRRVLRVVFRISFLAKHAMKHLSKSLGFITAAVATSFDSELHALQILPRDLH
jgi:hypothetical protein